MNSINFKTPTVPVAQPRQRIAVQGGRAINYTPAKHPVNVFKAALQMAFAEVYDGPPLICAIGVSVVFVMPRPKCRRRNAKRTWHTKKPDIDNLFKAVADALSGLAWVDDKQICEAVLRKQEAGDDEQPSCSVCIWEKS
jgi:Holliday junction resolvase RusA-like endonuclease